MNRVLPPCLLSLGAMALLGCPVENADGHARIFLTVERAAGAPHPEFLTVTWVGGGRVIEKDKRVPEKGNLPLSESEGWVGTLLIDLGASIEETTWRTVVVHGIDSDSATSEGAVWVVVEPRQTVTATVRLRGGRGRDDDEDGIPDDVDNCPRRNNPEQGQCGDGEDAGEDAESPTDGGSPNAADARADAGAGDDARTEASRDAGQPEAPTDGMTVIPAGSFKRGCKSGDSHCEKDEHPAKPIVLGEFEIDTTEVMESAYEKCVQAGACTAPTVPGYAPAARPTHPVNGITWAMATAYCRWAGKRLPSEAEWEKAARGPDTDRAYPWGDQAPDCTRVLFAGCGFNDVVPVGVLDGASVYGVQDMAGNVSEWVNDWYADDYYAKAPSTDPQGPLTGTQRVRRGGSFASDAYGVRVTARAAGEDADPAVQGFRCARDR